ncbi:helix-turn-helix domain-containing protein [Streptantibioticus cattleyicolor]|uniref:Transcriptional regulator, XRE family n=1 Tax=Streptantibioticus cattleyicolor (strain ATCC 35852 / DSM 46488 / JCM 4925 / NBRC 14057 / NRRL 8057) TaxID=1003195 RepID=F8JJ53_STREN|nr:helix-turn-helix transcriptional regulator [Streptantibioticus cattleyicolor]AEW98856.1 transcriptional regulator, XRE family [Streptantibioticus cattleyicolor NRRL 8057 = DSM 46488]CCB72100.1 putative DNA-binding protein [Streptantibioticus cattleyicolor NRRL 8057 = DSM 46488]
MNRKELNPEASPQAAYGARLRSLREARGWTQEELASRLEYSSVHISAVETGRKPPTLRFSRSADQAFGLTGSADAFERYYRELKHGALLEGFPEYVKCEGRAVEIRVFEIGIIPGLLQTPEYARVLADSAMRRGAITPEQAEERVSLLTERQAALVRDRPPMVFVTMDESCIRRPVGGPAVMDAQLARLVEFAQLPNTLLQVAPYEMGERRTFNLPVYLLTLPDRSVICYAESQAQGNLDRETTSVVPMLTAYHQLQAEALSQAASVAMIEQVRKGIS